MAIAKIVFLFMADMFSGDLNSVNTKAFYGASCKPPLWNIIEALSVVLTSLRAIYNLAVPAICHHAS